MTGSVRLPVQVRESTGPNSKQSPFYEDLLKAQEAAQAANKGLWTKVRQPAQLRCWLTGEGEGYGILWSCVCMLYWLCTATAPPNCHGAFMKMHCYQSSAFTQGHPDNA